VAIQEIEPTFANTHESNQSAPNLSAVFSSEGQKSEAILEETPCDPLTKQPLALLVRAADFHRENKDCMPEYHHQIHPGNDAELGNDIFGNLLPAGHPDRIEGLAVRHSRGQTVPNWLHDQYHDIFWGPKLPTESKDKHNTVLFGLAKVVSLQAIEITEPGKFRIVNLTEGEHDFLRRTTYHEGAGRSWIYNRRGRIGTYLSTYALENYLPQIIDDRKVALDIEHFLELANELADPASLRWGDEEVELQRGKPTRKQQKQHELAEVGGSIVQEAMMASVDYARPLYNEAIKAGMVKGTKRDLGQLAVKFFGQRRFPDYTPILTKYIDEAQNHHTRLRAA